MDISGWGMGEIMQLPDCAFGRRWMVSNAPFDMGTGHVWQMSDEALPERIVVWSLTLWHSAPLLADRWRFALGSQVPTSAAEMQGLEPLFRGLGYIEGPLGRYLDVGSFTDYLLRMRMPVDTAGRRFVTEFGRIKEIEMHIGFAGIEISSVPRSVPDWLISGVR